MWGLLIKDIQIALKNKRIFLVWFGVTLIFLFANNDPVFGISYSLFLMVIMLVGTISYDDFDNGMGFLMTLPITRKTYVMEKYVLVFLGTLVTGAITLVISMAYLLLHPEVMGMGDLVLTFVMLYAVMGIMASIYLPFQLKYGAEKGRLVLIVAAAIIFLGVFLVRKIKVAAEQAANIGAMLNALSPVSLMVLMIGVMVVALLLSIKISIGIVEKEEY